MTDHKAEFEELYRQRTLFFAEVGKCIIKYQTIEESIENIFAATLGGSKEKASAIFAVARGLEAKFAIVTAALCDAEAPLQERWTKLKKRIGKAAENRNQIAHSSPVSTQDTIVITKSRNPGEPYIISGGGNSRTEVRKKIRSGYATWTHQLLRDEFLRNADLSRALTAFSQELMSESMT